MTTADRAPQVRHDARAALLIAGVVAVSGPLVGTLWALIAPRALVEVRDGGVFLVDPEGPAFIAADGWFAVLGAIAGLLCAVAVFVRFRRHGPAAVLGLTAGGLLAAVIAWRVGSLLGPGDLESRAADAANGATLEAPLKLRALGMLFAWPLTSVSWYFALTLGFDPVQPPEAPDAVAARPHGQPDDAEYAA